MPEVPMPTTRWAGPGVIVGLVAGYAALWFAAAPAGQPAAAYLGQFLGAEAVLLLSIGLIGDGTAQLPDAVQPGMPAVIGGPFGRFSHAKGTTRQLWVASGIGVTPFLSWLRALDQRPPRGRVDFFYSSPDPDMPYADEISELAARCNLVQVHFFDSRRGHLTAEQILAEAGGTTAPPDRYRSSCAARQA